jgi:genome maintenance exonuclease 1
MKHFNHVQASTLTELVAETTGSGRVYNTPDGNRYPSVTTVLSELSKAGIAAWRKRVGAEEANRISTQASSRGTKVHQICEDYLNNKPDVFDGQMPANIFMFKQIQPILDTHIDNIQYLEAPLYSDFLKTAGRVDCIAEFDGKLSIIDFKTSRKPKKKEWISNYFMQASCYAVMYEERTKIPVSRTVVIIAVDGSESQVFIENRDNFIEQFVELRVSYKEKYGI